MPQINGVSMPIFTLKLLNRRDEATNTIVCDFEKPEGFKFIPGQYGGFTLLKPEITDDHGITRRFSIMSSPDDATISIVTRVQSSAFKKNLTTMPIASEIKFAGPTGNFILHEDKEAPAVFIAGGIGIAPFYSMIRHVCKNQPERHMVLFYGNQRMETSAFHHELDALSKQHKNFTFIPVMADDANWNGENGFITHTLIKKYVTDLTKPVFYVCGAPGMVTALQETLVEMDINEEHIKVEDFPGY
jgi:ferredoxin-NADP reductase